MDARDKGHYHDVSCLSGRIYKEGYPASFEPEISDINTITFSRGKDGKIAAEVKKIDGTVTSGIENIKFWVEPSDSRQNTIKAKIIRFKIADTILEIPVQDIKSITRKGKEESYNGYYGLVLVLKKGKTLEGKTSWRYLVCGKTTAMGEEVDFIGSLQTIKSIIFNQDRSDNSNR